MTTSRRPSGHGPTRLGDGPQERDWTSDRLRALALRVFLASIAINALLGIWALLAGDFGETEGKVLATSLLLSAAILSVLVNGAPLQRRVLWPVPVVAAAAGVASILGFVVMMWAEIDHEVPLKLAVSGLVVAAAATLVGLLALLPLHSTHQPVRYLHNGLTALLTGTILWGIWGEVGSGWYGRFLGVQSVLVAALTLAVPVLWRFGGRPRPPAPMVGDPGVATLGDLMSTVSAVSAGAGPERPTAAEAMSTGLDTLPDSATVEAAARLMVDHRLDQLLVTGERGGVLSIHDILAAVIGAPTSSTGPQGGTAG